MTAARLTATAATDTALDQFRAAGRLAALGLRPRRAMRVAETMRRAAFSIAEDALRPTPGSYLNRPIDGRRTLLTGSVPLQRLNRIKRRSDSKLNDVVLSVATGALRRLAALREADPCPLRAMVPVSVREENDAKASGNRISFAFVDLPVDEPAAARRLALLRARMADLKQSGRVAGSDMLLRNVVGQLPGPLKDQAARFATSSRLFNLTISNVPGPRRPLYAAGVRVESIHPVIPLSDGHACALGVLSYGGSLQLGVHAHPEALPEAEELPALFRAAVTELESALDRAPQLPRTRRRRALGAAGHARGRPAAV
jgi:WS/DGAT/MGAT family acyltransferase